MKKYPPKPADQPAAPRFKKKNVEKHGTPGRKSIMDALGRLTSAKPGVTDLLEYWQEVQPPENARGAAVLIAANVENALDLAIIRTFDISESREKELFSQQGPLATFSNKIRFAHALGIIGDETRANLDVIRVIRNTFAHAKIPLSFDHPDILSACGLLSIPAHVPKLTPISDDRLVNAMMNAETQQKIGRARYRHVCDTLTYNLFHFASSGPIFFEASAFEDPSFRPQIDRTLVVVARPKPLP